MTEHKQNIKSSTIKNLTAPTPFNSPNLPSVPYLRPRKGNIDDIPELNLSENKEDKETKSPSPRAEVKTANKIFEIQREI